MHMIVMMVLLAGCDSEGSCETEGAYQCSGEVLEVCTDGAWVEEEDCAAEELVCHAEGGHCMEAMDMDDSGM